MTVCTHVFAGRLQVQVCVSRNFELGERILSGKVCRCQSAATRQTGKLSTATVCPRRLRLCATFQHAHSMHGPSPRQEWTSATVRTYCTWLSREPTASQVRQHSPCLLALCPCLSRCLYPCDCCRDTSRRATHHIALCAATAARRKHACQLTRSITYMCTGALVHGSSNLRTCVGSRNG